MSSRYFFPTILLILFFFTIATTAQDTCSELVNRAFEQIENVCSDIGRNQVCYGHSLIDAVPTESVDTFDFDSEGDFEDVASFGTIQLSGMNPDTETWGIVFMAIQADLPDTLPGQNVKMLLFGDVEIENATVASVDVPMTATGGVNVRSYPTTTTNNVILSLTGGQEVIATGRLADGSWIRIKFDDRTQGFGWVSSQFLMGDFDRLVIVEPDTAQFNPMQAFYFRTGIRDRSCQEAPDSGILIQTPKGAGTITINANRIDILLGSTIYLQSDENSFLIYVLEGQAIVIGQFVNQAIPAGTLTRVLTDEASQFEGLPQIAQPYDLEVLESLPLDFALLDPITITPPLEASEINSAIADVESSVADTSSTSETGNTTDANTGLRGCVATPATPDINMYSAPSRSASVVDILHIPNVGFIGIIPTNQNGWYQSEGFHNGQIVWLAAEDVVLVNC